MYTLATFQFVITGIALSAVLLNNPLPAQERSGAGIRPVRGTTVTPAEQKIAAVKSRIEEHPKDPAAWSALAVAYSQRARETANHAWYVEGEKAAAKALAIDADHFEALRTRVWLLLGQHEFQQARDLGLKLNKRNPDDVLLYGFLADACAELGLYDETERHVQKMLDMRPPSVASLSRTAYLREVFGNLDGALDVMSQAYRMTPSAATEDRAWLLTQIGHLYLLRGNLPMAGQVLEQAMEAFPDYHYALAQMAKLERMNGDWQAAAELLSRRYEIAPHPENLFDLAEVNEKAGNTVVAHRQWKEFEQAALAESENNDNANRELIAYYAQYAGKPQMAVELASRELSRRKDVFTMLRAAEAYEANGNHERARRLVDEVLAIGYRDADALFLAGRLADTAGNRDRARQLYMEANAFNPKSASARLAMERLLGGRSSATYPQ